MALYACPLLRFQLHRDVLVLHLRQVQHVGRDAHRQGVEFPVELVPHLRPYPRGFLHRPSAGDVDRLERRVGSLVLLLRRAKNARIEEPVLRKDRQGRLPEGRPRQGVPVPRALPQGVGELRHLRPRISQPVALVEDDPFPLHRQRPVRERRTPQALVLMTITGTFPKTLHVFMCSSAFFVRFATGIPARGSTE